MTRVRSYAGAERRRAKPSKTAVATALLGVAAIAVVTLGPIGLRPHVANANVERFAAFLVLGLLISRAAGRRGLGATLLIIALAFGLEAGQLLAPGRHAHLADAAVKALGGVSGVATLQLMYPFRRLIARLSGLADHRGETIPLYVTSR